MMSDPSLGTWLRSERERRGMALKTISNRTKVSASLLEGLENDDLAHWPGGIFRRGFVRAYATAVGLDPDEVMRRFEQEHGACPEPSAAPTKAPAAIVAGALAEPPSAPRPVARSLSRRSRVLGTLADLTVALVLALASAAAGSRLLWPVLAIAAYYALGILFTGTSPMVALLNDQPTLPLSPQSDALTDQSPRPAVDRRHQLRRTTTRAQRTAHATRPRVQ